MVPSHFIWLERVPLTSNGKVDRSALVKLHAARNLLNMDDSSAISDQHSQADNLREIIYCVWREVLRVARVSPDDDFIGLGGNSLAAVRLMIRTRKALNKPTLPLQLIFDCTRAGEFVEAVLRFEED